MALQQVDFGALRRYRINRLTDQMEADDVDALILQGYLNTKYVTDFQMRGGHYYGEIHDWVILLRSGEYVFFSSPFFRPETRRYCPWIRRIEDPEKIWEVIEELSLQKAKVGLDFILPYPFVDELKKRFPSMQCVDATDYINEAKIIKSPDELAVIKEAALVAGVGMTAGLEAVEPGKSESDIAAACEYAVWTQGRGAFPFNSYVAAGENSAFVCENTLQRRIRKGDLVYIDMGCVLCGYVIEFCRTTTCGKPTRKQKDIYQIVYRALQESLKVMKPGCSSDEISKIQAGILAESGYPLEGTLPIHSIGIGYHEWPADYLKTDISWYPCKEEDVKLREGMVVNLEPGIFTGDPDVGGVRLEDTIEITKDGCYVLTKAPYDKELLS